MEFSIKEDRKYIGRDSIGFVEYLDKENKENIDQIVYFESNNEKLDLKLKAYKREYFFSNTENKLDKLQVVNIIEKSAYDLKATEAKFFSIIICPSQEELKYLKSLYSDELIKEKLKEYTRDVMGGYAIYLNRELDGRPIRGNDLIWFGMCESKRIFKYKDFEVMYNNFYSKLDEEVKKGESQYMPILKNMKWLYVLDEKGQIQKRETLEEKDQIIRNGLEKIKEHGNLHIHVIVHKRDQSGILRLNPMYKKPIKNYYLNGERIFSREKYLELKKKYGESHPNYFFEEKEEKKKEIDQAYFSKFTEELFDLKFGYKRVGRKEESKNRENSFFKSLSNFIKNPLLLLRKNLLLNSSINKINSKNSIKEKLDFQHKEIQENQKVLGLSPKALALKVFK